MGGSTPICYNRVNSKLLLTTGRISGISRALIEGIEGINKINERRGYSRYTLRHFCEDPISGDHTTRRTGPGPRHKHGQNVPSSPESRFSRP